jgi:hypothetical protein
MILHKLYIHRRKERIHKGFKRFFVDKPVDIVDRMHVCLSSVHAVYTCPEKCRKHGERSEEDGIKMRDKE